MSTPVVTANVSAEDILNLFQTFVSVGLQLAPVLMNAINDWKNGSITAEEADAKANGQFSAMALALANMKKDEADTNAAVDAEVTKKFSPPTRTGS